MQEHGIMHEGVSFFFLWILALGRLHAWWVSINSYILYFKWGKSSTPSTLRMNSMHGCHENHADIIVFGTHY